MEMPGTSPLRGDDADDTQSHHILGVHLRLWSSRNWSVSREGANTGSHEKALVHGTCSRLATLHGDPRTPVLL